MEIDAYLRRIGFGGRVLLDANTLGAIHQAHLYSVPFENLDIGLGRPIQLDLERIYQKVVTRRRGGFCYELNGLLGWLLRELGFGVTLVSAQGANADGGFSAEYDHLLLLVTCPGDARRWLADVGWGAGFETPLDVDAFGAQAAGRGTWRIDRGGGYSSLWQQTGSGGWIQQYRFTLAGRAYSEFAGMCAYHQTSPSSIFVQKKLCTLFTADGRVTLSQDKLIITRGAESDERDVPETQRAEVLKQYFGVVL